MTMSKTLAALAASTALFAAAPIALAQQDGTRDAIQEQGSPDSATSGAANTATPDPAIENSTQQDIQDQASPDGANSATANTAGDPTATPGINNSTPEPDLAVKDK